jgi:predicted GNAT superfamily acetyltransferase
MTAADDAANAALKSGVDIRELERLSEFTRLVELFDEIWRPTIQPISAEMLRAFSKAGNYVVGAFEGPTMVGGSAGFFAAPAHNTLHSHIAGVSGPGTAGRHIGYALKLHQRAWALSQGVGRIDWTFDPLVARNAYFNIVKLGGLPAEYLPNFYGDMADGINGDDDSDRLLLRWDLDAPRAVDASAGRLAPAHTDGVAIALDRDDHDRPRLGSTEAETVLVAVPRDVEALRQQDSGAAKAWRIAVREVLGGLLAEGAEVTGFARDGWYVVRRVEAA